MNQVTFVGRICREVETRKVSASHQVINNVIAVKRSYKDRNGEAVTDFIPFVAWDGLARTLENYAEKGQRIAISGLMQSRMYTNKEKQDIYVIECNIRELTLLDKAKPKQNQHELEILEKGLTAEDLQLTNEMVKDVIKQLS